MFFDSTRSAPEGQFGVRSEVNVYLAEAEVVVTGQPIQTHVTPILSL
jgi:hypothetical protein